jgi:5'-3' exonuclease
MSTMSSLRLRTKTARTAYHVMRAGLGPNGLRARVEALEREVQESRTLNRRIAELTDVVTELLVPLHDRDQAKVNDVIAAYRNKI